MKYLFDIDGVILKHNKGYTEMAKGVNENDPIIAKAAMKFFQTDVWRNYTRSLKPMKDIGVLRKIIKEHEVHAVSRRVLLDLNLLINLFNKHDINIAEERIHLREDFKYYNEWEFKRNVADIYKVDGFWDDDLDIAHKIPNGQLFINWEDVEAYLRDIK